MSDTYANDDHAWFQDAARWRVKSPCLVISMMLAGCLHAGIAWSLLRPEQTIELDATNPPAATLMDLTPLPAPPLTSHPAPSPATPPAPAIPEPITPEPVTPEIVAPSTPVETLAVPVAEKPVVKPNPPPRPVERRHPRVVPSTSPIRPTVLTETQVTTPPPLAAASATLASSGPASTAVPNWRSLVVRRLEHFKHYPAASQMRRQEGTTYLHFTMNRNGNILSARVEKSSGFSELDDETLALIRRADPLPPPPAEISGDSIELVVPVRFKQR